MIVHVLCNQQLNAYIKKAIKYVTGIKFLVTVLGIIKEKDYAI